MAGIQDIPIAIPDKWENFRPWFKQVFIGQILSKLDPRNATGSGVTITSDGNSVANFDASEELTLHIESDDPHPQYAKSTDLDVYTQKNAAETIEAAWTFPAANPLITGSTTVAGLPSAATVGAGARAFVTDATSTTFNAAAAGGGANKVPVFSDGSAWRVG